MGFRRCAVTLPGAGGAATLRRSGGRVALRRCDAVGAATRDPRCDAVGAATLYTFCQSAHGVAGLISCDAQGAPYCTGAVRG